jgi:hypothetical protein
LIPLTICTYVPLKGLHQNVIDKNKIEEIFAIVNNDIFEFLNSKKNRSFISNKLSLKVINDFKLILNDPNFNRQLLIENLYNCQAKAILFLKKDNLNTEKLSFANETIENMIDQNNQFNHKTENNSEDEKTHKSSYFLILVIIIVLIAVALGVFGYKLWKVSQDVENTQNHKDINPIVDVKNIISKIDNQPLSERLLLDSSMSTRTQNQSEHELNNVNVLSQQVLMSGDIKSVNEPNFVESDSGVASSTVLQHHIQSNSVFDFKNAVYQNFKI